MLPSANSTLRFLSTILCWLNLFRHTGKEPACQCRRRKRREVDPWVGKIPWSRRWQPSPVFLPGKFHGQRSPAGYSPWGHKESDTTERLRTHIVLLNSFFPLLCCWPGNASTCISQAIAKVGGNLWDCWICQHKPLSVHDAWDPWPISLFLVNNPKLGECCTQTLYKNRDSKQG